MRNQKIRILHLVDSLNVGGAEILIGEIIKALGNKNYEHYLFYFLKDGPMRERLSKLNITIYRGYKRSSIKKPVYFLITSMLLIIDLFLFIKKNRIQIIQSHMGPGNQLGVLVGKLSRIPIFTTVHTPFVFMENINKKNIVQKLQMITNHFIYRIADIVIVVSEEIKEIMIDRFGLVEDKIFILKNGITLNNAKQEYRIDKKKYDKKNEIKIN
jgi:glycosyltransferase involved in cell wall biosynthesis